MSQKFSRRTVLQRTLLATSATLFPGLIPLAVSQSQEDPVAIIEGFAKELFALFGGIERNSDRYASRRQALTAVVDDRFAYDMIETAAAVAVPEMDDDQLVQLHGLGRDLVVEFLLTFFVQYGSDNEFVAHSVRTSRSGKRSRLETSLTSSNGVDVPIRWDLIQRDGRYYVYDVRVFGISLISDVTRAAERGYDTGGMFLLFRTLDQRVKDCAAAFQTNVLACVDGSLRLVCSART